MRDVNIALKTSVLLAEYVKFPYFLRCVSKLRIKYTENPQLRKGEKITARNFGPSL